MKKKAGLKTKAQSHKGKSFFTIFRDIFTYSD
jgi:hypothetical protein